MTWTIPLVMSNMNNNPANQYGLVGVVTLNQTGSNPNTYTGNVVFTKPGNAFANQQFNLQNIQYPYPSSPYQGQLYFEIGAQANGTTPIQLAQQFNSAESRVQWDCTPRSAVDTLARPDGGSGFPRRLP